MTISGLAFKIGRRVGKHPLAGRIFCLTERLLPIKRIARANGLVAIHHPRPITVPHILIVPTRPVSSLTTEQLSDKEKSGLLWTMVELGRELTSQLPASEQWHLVINGGSRQDIGQLHGHLLHAAKESDPDPKPLGDPEINFTCWQALFRELHEADQLPENGFSVIFEWGLEPYVEVAISQSITT